MSTGTLQRHRRVGQGQAQPVPGLVPREEHEAALQALREQHERELEALRQQLGQAQAEIVRLTDEIDDDKPTIPPATPPAAAAPAAAEPPKKQPPKGK